MCSFYRAAPFIEAYKVLHRTISHFFCSGKDTGLRIMNLDAKIARNVVNEFVKLGKPILAIHDSFIVKREDATALAMIMKKVYYERTGGLEVRLKSNFELEILGSKIVRTK